MVDTIKRLCKEKKTTIAAIERACGFGNGSIRKWDSASPAYERIKAVADFLEVPVSELTGEQKEKAPTGTGERMSDDELKVALFGSLDIDDADLDDVKRYAAFIRDKKRGK